jgi:hypothetical protein
MRHSGSSFDNFRCRIIDSLVDLFLFTIQDLLNFIVAKGEEGERWRGRAMREGEEREGEEREGEEREGEERESDGEGEGSESDEGGKGETGFIG